MEMDFISTLPDELLDRLLHHLEAKDLVRASFACRRFFKVAQSERHWLSLCSIDWSITELPEHEASTWKHVYADMYHRFGPYVKCYSRINRCWQQLFSVTQSRAPVIYASLMRDGASEDVLNNIQQSLGEHAQLPLEFRCSYRLCNGQALPRAVAPGVWSFAGLFGSYQDDDYGDYLCTWTNGETRVQQPDLWHANPEIVRHCCLSHIYVARRTVHEMSTHGGVALCIRDGESSPSRTSCQRNERHARLNGCMVSMGAKNPKRVEFFVFGNSFVEFMEDFAKRANSYPVVNNRFLKFDFNSEGVTGPYTVTTRTSFYRERSVAFPFERREFHFFYRITMHMRPDARQSDSCQLATRHWIITNSNGQITEVSGPGVVGNYPVLRPGAEFTWISRTSYGTTTGTMHGYFTMRKIGFGDAVRIDCPLYKMAAPEFMEG